MRHWLAPSLASIGFVGLVATFAVEMGSFRRAVEAWAARDLSARTELAAANLRENLRTGDFKALYGFGAACEREGLHLTVFSAGGGVFFNSQPTTNNQRPTTAAVVYATAASGEFSVRLGLPRERVLAPFRRARFGFLLAALAGGAGMLLVFFFTYRQHVRIRELARLEKFRREFVADVSHELKTPLTGILGAVDLLGMREKVKVRGEGEKVKVRGEGEQWRDNNSSVHLGSSPSPKSRTTNHEVERKLLAMIGREAKRLDALAQGILDLARLERADEAIHKTQTDLAELVRDVVESLQPQAEAKGIRIEVKVKGEGEKVKVKGEGEGEKVKVKGEGEGEKVKVNGELILRAVSNLVGNAIRHSGSKDVVVSLERAGREVHIIVEDHGRGIPAAEAKRVFERFHRVDPARAAETGGAGLGLAIVRRIARLHGGDVALSAVSPSGCRFTLSLPG